MSINFPSIFSELNSFAYAQIHVRVAYLFFKYVRETAYFLCFFVFSASEFSISPEMSFFFHQNKYMQAPAILSFFLRVVLALNCIYLTSRIGCK